MTMSPFGDALRNRIRLFPNLVNCSTVIWYREWPEEGLTAVAQKMLSNIGIELGAQRSLVPVCKFYHKSVQELSARFKSEEGRQVFSTPSSYIELFI